VDGLDATALRKLLAGKTVDVTPWIGDLQEGLRGSARPENLETLFQLIYLYMTEPRKDAEAYQVYLQRLKTNLENRASSPQSVFYDTVGDLLSQHHPRGRPWGPERVREMDLDASLRVYRDRFKDAGDFHFFFVGSFTLPGIEPLVRRYLGSLPTQGRVESWKDVGIRPPKGIVQKEVRKGLEPQSRVELVYSGTTPWSLENSMRADALGRVMDIDMREAVREKAGGSYDVGVEGQLDRYPVEEYLLTIGFGCAPQNVEQMTSLAVGEVARLREQGPNAADVAKVKEMLKREHEQNLRENEYWLGSLQMLSFNQRVGSPRRAGFRQEARRDLRGESQGGGRGASQAGHLPAGRPVPRGVGRAGRGGIKQPPRLGGVRDAPPAPQPEAGEGMQ